MGRFPEGQPGGPSCNHLAIGPGPWGLRPARSLLRMLEPLAAPPLCLIASHNEGIRDKMFTVT